MGTNRISEPEQFRKLFVGGLNYKTTEESMKNHFEKWGKIVDCIVMRESNTRRSRGFGFVTYQKAFMVDDAQAARPHKIDGREVELKRVAPKKDLGKPEAHMTVESLFVGNLGNMIEENDLREYFGEYGNILSINVVSDKNTGKKRGFAFIDFDDYDPVDKIILRNHYLKGKKLEVRKAFPRQEMDSINQVKEMEIAGARSDCRGCADNYGALGYRKLAEDLKYLYITKRNTDVILTVKERPFSAHKAILEARSPVFAAMFENDMLEKKTGEIIIPDCDPDAFNAFLLFLYSAEEDFSKCSFYELYKIAHKYDVPELKSSCVDLMIRNISVENFSETIILGHKFDDDELLIQVQDFFEANFEKIVSSKSWESLLKNNFRLTNKLLRVMAPKIKLTK